MVKAVKGPEGNVLPMGRILERVRQDAERSAYEVGRSIGLSCGQVLAIEGGHRQVPSYGTLANWFKVLNYSRAKSWYLSGPMTGIEDFNHPAFNDYADALMHLGFRVVNPVNVLPYAPEHAWEDYLLADISALVRRCCGVFLLHGWERSYGARLEVEIARLLGWPVVSASALVPSVRPIVSEAA